MMWSRSQACIHAPTEVASASMQWLTVHAACAVHRAMYAQKAVTQAWCLEFNQHAMLLACSDDACKIAFFLKLTYSL